MRLKFNPTQHETPQRLLNNQGTQAARRTAGRPSCTGREIDAARTKIRASVEALVSAPSESSGAQKGRSQIGKRVASKCVEVSCTAAHGVAEQRVKPIHRAGLASRKAQRQRAAQHGSAGTCKAKQRGQPLGNRRLSESQGSLQRVEARRKARHSTEGNCKATRHASTGCMASRFDSKAAHRKAAHRIEWQGTASNGRAEQTNAASRLAIAGCPSRFDSTETY